MTTLVASTVGIELKIYGNILDNLLPEKQIISIWTDNPKKRELLDSIRRVKMVSDAKDANILILYNTKCFSTDKIIFIGTYALLKQCKDKAIGGFYWQKGRPNLVFLRNNLQRHTVHLSQELEEFIEDEI